MADLGAFPDFAEALDDLAATAIYADLAMELEARFHQGKTDGVAWTADELEDLVACAIATRQAEVSGGTGTTEPYANTTATVPPIRNIKPG